MVIGVIGAPSCIRSRSASSTTNLHLRFAVKELRGLFTTKTTFCRVDNRHTLYIIPVILVHKKGDVVRNDNGNGNVTVNKLPLNRGKGGG